MLVLLLLVAAVAEVVAAVAEVVGAVPVVTSHPVVAAWPPQLLPCPSPGPRPLTVRVRSTRT